jgi:hypothetical protein
MSLPTTLNVGAESQATVAEEFSRATLAFFHSMGVPVLENSPEYKLLGRAYVPSIIVLELTPFFVDLATGASRSKTEMDLVKGMGFAVGAIVGTDLAGNTPIVSGLMGLAFGEAGERLMVSLLTAARVEQGSEYLTYDGRDYLDNPTRFRLLENPTDASPGLVW